MSDIAILEKTICIQLEVSLWSGTRRLQVEDLGTAAADLPPEDLASRGSLKLCDPKLLAPLANIKRKAEVDCEEVCVGFLRGYATDANNVDALVKKLEGRRKEFLASVVDLTANLPDAMNAWVAQHATWKSVIEREVPNAHSVAARYDFRYQFFRVGAASAELDHPLNEGLGHSTQGLSGRLFQEIQAEASAAFKRSFSQRDVVGQKALGPLWRILKKLEALRYLDARCAGMIERIGAVLNGLPKTGAIGEPHLSAIVGLFAILGSAEAALRPAVTMEPATNGTHSIGDLFERERANGEPGPDRGAITLPMNPVETNGVSPDSPPREPPREGVPPAAEPPAAVWV